MSIREARLGLDRSAASITLYWRRIALLFRAKCTSVKIVRLDSSNSRGRSCRPRPPGGGMKASREERDQNVRRRESRGGKEIQGGRYSGKRTPRDTQWSPGRRRGPIVETEKVSHRSLSLSLPFYIFHILRRTKMQQEYADRRSYRARGIRSALIVLESGFSSESSFPISSIKNVNECVWVY